MNGKRFPDAPGAVREFFAEITFADNTEMSNIFMEEYLEQFQELIGYSFRNTNLLKQALTHSSFTNEQRINRIGDYERLEFLGDAVLELVSSDFLYRKYPDKTEGELTRVRASMVCEPSLAFCARDISLGQFIRLGKGEEQTGGRDRDSITSDVMEAVIGAIYLDGGFEAAKKHIHRFILSDLEGKMLFFDAKSQLQELLQGVLKKEFHYEVSQQESQNPDGAFGASVYMEEEVIGSGEGHSKKTAEQNAAYAALLYLREKGYVSKKY